MPEPSSARTLRALRARAHAHKPVVWIAATGATEGVVRELDRALAAHELVKIRADIDEREERGRLLQSLCEELGAQPVQTIGKMLVAFRPRPATAEPAMARADAAKRATGKRSSARQKTVRRKQPSRPHKRAR